uniref:Mis18 domain-containing protein n=1 Tax=Accipiter nisus TaxID=211598 RepID=A0A8B9M775_9AVES
MDGKAGSRGEGSPVEGVWPTAVLCLGKHRPTCFTEGGAENADLLPMVFLCAGCKRPVGDTLSWVTNDEETGCILLRSESCARQPPPPRPAARGGRWSPPSLPAFPPPLCAQVRPPASRWTRSGSSPSCPASADGEARPRSPAAAPPWALPSRS